MVSLGFVLKLTIASLRHTALCAAAAALFVGLSWPWAIEQSKTQVADWLTNPTLMLDTAVLMSIDIMIMLAYCIAAIHTPRRGTRRWYFRQALHYYPGLLFFVVLFSSLVYTIFSLPGADFALTAWLLAAAWLIVIPLAAWGLRLLLPEVELRLELLFITHILIAALGIVATVNGTTAVRYNQPTDLPSLLALLGCVAVGTTAGYLWWIIKNKYIRKR